MAESTMSEDGLLDVAFGRRRFLVVSGAGAAAVALIAACGEQESGDAGIARVGEAPSTTALPTAVVTDAVLLRTASSMEHTIIAMYDRVLEGGDQTLVAEESRTYFTQFRENHVAHAETFARLTTEAGGEPWSCPNPRLETIVVTPVFDAINGKAAEGETAATPASDDPERDVLSFAHAMESMAGASYQALVGMLSVPALRMEAIKVAAAVVRHASALALLITPESYVTPEGIEQATGDTVPTTSVAPSTTQDIAAVTTVGPGDSVAPAPPATPIPAVYAIPSQFGSLASTQLVVGAPDAETGNRLSLNLETPSLNTFVYEYMTDCDASASA
jgi:hypothetical protein